MAWWLGACAALPQDLSSIPSTHTTPAPRDPTLMHRQTRPPAIKIINVLKTMNIKFGITTGPNGSTAGYTKPCLHNV